MEGSGGSVSFWGKRKTLHIVLAVITFGLWLLALLALYLWRKGRKGWSIASASALGLVVLLIGIGAAAATESETMTEAAESESEPTVLTTTFVSPRNGFSIKHPDTVVVTPAKQIWGFSGQIDDGFDVVETGSAAVFRGASTGPPFMENGFVAGLDGVSIDEWVDDMTEDLPGGCSVPRSQQAEITIDGHAGRISEDCPDRIVATVVAGGRLYLFTLLHDRTDARAVFDAFAATIDLTPETAVEVPNLTSTFVSPTNGFSFKYIRGLTPAKELWDPITQPRSDTSGVRDAPFDVVETGLAAYFMSASTDIPDGVSIDEVDEWVDEYVSSGRCRVPRSQQAEITIDGQSGRISECPTTEATVDAFGATVVAGGEIEATVVAGGRLYLFILLSDRSDFRAFFDAFAATIDLRPEDAAVR